MKIRILTFFILFCSLKMYAEDGYDLWLRYVPVRENTLLTAYQNQIKGISISNNSDVTKVASEELQRGLFQKCRFLTGLRSLKRLWIIIKV